MNRRMLRIFGFCMMGVLSHPLGGWPPPSQPSSWVYPLEDISDHTALQEAIILGEGSKIEQLLKSVNIDVNENPAIIFKRSAGKWNATPLHLAINKKDKISLVALLNHAGIDLNKKDNFEKSPLQQAIDLRYKKGISILLAHGADTKLLTEEQTIEMQRLLEEDTCTIL